VLASHYSLPSLNPSGSLVHVKESPAPPPRIAPARRVGNIHDTYQFTDADRLGDGAYSVVFRARHRVTGEAVAIKRVDISRTNSSALAVHSGVDPLQEEVKILAALRHRHIVQLYEVVQEPGPKVSSPVLGARWAGA